MTKSSLLCVGCGYLLIGLSTERCPECGKLAPLRAQQEPTPPFWSLELRPHLFGIVSSLMLLLLIGGIFGWMMFGRLSKSLWLQLAAAEDAIGPLVIVNLLVSELIAASAKGERQRDASTAGFLLALALLALAALMPAFGSA